MADALDAEAAANHVSRESLRNQANRRVADGGHLDGGVWRHLGVATAAQAAAIDAGGSPASVRGWATSTSLSLDKKDRFRPAGLAVPRSVH